MYPEITIHCQERKTADMLKNGTDWKTFRSELKRRGALTSMSARQLLLSAAIQTRQGQGNTASDEVIDSSSSNSLSTEKVDGPIKNMDLLHLISMKKQNSNLGQRLWTSQASLSCGSTEISDLPSRNLHDIECSTTPLNSRTRQSRIAAALHSAMNITSLQDEL